MDKSDGIVYVGEKHVMSYVEAIITQLNMNQEVKVIARGMNISIAVDATEISKRTLLSNQKLQIDTVIGSEDMTRRGSNDSKKKRISTITITIKKIK